MPPSDEFRQPPACREGIQLSTYSPEERSLMEKPKEEMTKKWQLRPILVHLLIMIFGTSAWIGVNGIFIQLPLLVDRAPEGWKLAAHLVVIVQAANVAPIFYSLLRKTRFEINESGLILGMLGIGSLVMGLLAFFYDKTSSVAGKEYSSALFALTFLTAAVSCTSSVLFMPYLRNYKEVYLVSYFIGEGLSGVLPSFVALIQGVNESSTCVDATVTDATFPRFSPRYYFSFLFTCMLLSSIAFFILDNLPYLKKERIIPRASENNTSSNEAESCHCQKPASASSKDSIDENKVTEKHVCIDKYKKTDVGGVSHVYYPKTKNHRLSSKNVYLYILLSVICLLANGFLPGLQPYSCLSYGNMTYHLSATLSQIANPTACFLALWCLPQRRKIINWLSVVIFLASGYVVYLALVSPDPPLRDSKFGKALAILSWILLVGFMSYVKLLITSVFRRKSESLFIVGVIIQAGSACGAIISFVLINFANILEEYKSCESLKN